MRDRTKNALFLILALIIANVVYQAFGVADWMTAFERSWFQATAVAFAWWQL